MVAAPASAVDSLTCRSPASTNSTGIPLGPAQYAGIVDTRPYASLALDDAV